MLITESILPLADIHNECLRRSRIQSLSYADPRVGVAGEPRLRVRVQIHASSHADVVMVEVAIVVEASSELIESPSFLMIKTTSIIA